MRQPGSLDDLGHLGANHAPTHLDIVDESLAILFNLRRQFIEPILMLPHNDVLPSRMLLRHRRVDEQLVVLGGSRRGRLLARCRLLCPRDHLQLVDIGTPLILCAWIRRSAVCLTRVVVGIGGPMIPAGSVRRTGVIHPLAPLGDLPHQHRLSGARTARGAIA